MSALDQAETSINAAISRGVLTCDAAIFGETVAAKIASDLCVHQLEILGPTLEKRDGELLVDGTATLFGFQKLAMHMVVREKDTNLCVTLSFSPKQDWLVSDKLVQLKNTIFDDWNVPNSTVVLSTFEHRDDAVGATLTAGLNILSDFELPSNLGQADLLLGAGSKKVLLRINGSDVGVDIIGSALSIGMTAPDFDFRIATAGVEQLDLAAVLKKLLPSVAVEIPDDIIPAVTFKNLEMLLAPSRHFISFSADALFGGVGKQGWKVGPAEISDLNVQLMMLGDMTREPRNLMAIIGGTAQIGSVEVNVIADFADSLTVTGVVHGLKLSNLGNLLKSEFSIPDFLQELEIPEITLRVCPVQKTFALTARAEGSWSLPGCGESAVVKRIDLALSCDFNDVAKSITGSISVDGVGGPVVKDALAIDDFTLIASLNGLHNWSVSGFLNAELFGEKLSLEAGFSDAAGTKTLQLQMDFQPALSVIRFAGVGELALSKFSMCWSKGPAEAGNDPSAAWSIAGQGTLKVANACDLAGDISLDRPSADSVNFVLQVTGEALLPIPLPKPGPAIVIKGGKLAISRQGESWSLACSTEIGFKGWPSWMKVDQESGIRVSLLIAPERFELKTCDWHKGVSVKLPSLKRGSAAEVDLGEIDVTLKGITVSISRSEPLALSLDMAFTIPEAANRIFGVDDAGNPVRQWFKTGPVNLAITGGLLSQNSLPGLKLNLLDSPLQMISLTPGRNEGERWWNLDLGRAGTMQLLVPSFAQSGESFSASGGFDQKLKVPVFLLKELAGGVLPKSLLQSLPDAIPLSDVALFSEQDGLRVDQLESFARRLGIVLPDELHKAFSVLQTASKNLPDRLKHYLAAKLPTHCGFSIDVKASGDLTFMAVAGQEGAEHDASLRESLCILIPTFPVMIGIELRKIEFGPVLGGALFKLDVDLDIDLFDIPSVVASAALGDSWPTIKQTHTTYNCDQLTAFVLYETGIPIPLPVYFEKLGVDFQGPLGTVARTSISFTPQLDLAEFLGALGDVWGFLSRDPSKLLPEKPRSALKARLALNESFIELPRFLGAGDTPGAGKVLGVKGKPVFDVDLSEAVADRVYPTIARTLNALKTLSLPQIVAAIPFDERVNDIHLALGPVAINAGWVLTTESEYTANFGSNDRAKLPPGVQKLIALDGGTRAALLKNLPAVSEGEGADDRILALIMGSWGAAGLADLSIGFGLVAGGKQGVSTAIIMNGSLGSTTRLMLSGSVAAATGKGAEAFDAHATSTLSIAGVKVWDGEVELHVDRSQFHFEGAFHLLDRNWPVFVDASAIATLSNTEFLLNGEGTAQYLLVDGACKLNVASDRVLVSLHALNDESVCEFSIWQSDDGNRLEMAGRMKLFTLYEFEATLELDRSGGVAAAQRSEGFSLHGDATLKLYGRQIFTGQVTILSRELFAFDGRLALFADGALVSVNGQTKGRCDRDGLIFQSGLTAKLGFIALSGEAHLALTSGSLKVGGMWGPYGQINLDLLAKNDVLTGHFDAQFGPASVNVNATITSGRKLDLMFTAGSGSALKLVGAFKETAGKEFASNGRSSLTMSGLILSEGSMSWSKDGFTISQQITFGLVTAKIDGGLDQRGLHLGGGYEFGIRIPFVGLVGYGVHLAVSQLSVQVTLTLPVGTTGTGAIAPYGRKLATFIQLHLSLFNLNVWIVVPRDAYPIISWSKPSAWPRPIESASTTIFMLQSEAPAREGGNLLSALAAVLDQTEAVPEVAAEVWRVLADYRVTNSESGGPSHGGPWAEAYRSAFEIDFFTGLADFVGSKDFSVEDASAIFEPLSGQRRMTITLTAQLAGKPMRVTTVIDPENVAIAFDYISAEIAARRDTR